MRRLPSIKLANVLHCFGLHISRKLHVGVAFQNSRHWLVALLVLQVVFGVVEFPVDGFSIARFSSHLQLLAVQGQVLIAEVTALSLTIRLLFLLQINGNRVFFHADLIPIVRVRPLCKRTVRLARHLR